MKKRGSIFYAFLCLSMPYLDFAHGASAYVNTATPENPTGSITTYFSTKVRFRSNFVFLKLLPRNPRLLCRFFRNDKSWTVHFSAYSSFNSFQFFNTLKLNIMTAPKTA